MKRKKIHSVFLILLLLLITGCEIQYDFLQAAESGEGFTVPEALGESGNMSYTVTSIKPRIRVNQVGYRPDSRKVAVFCTDQELFMDEQEEAIEFRVIDCSTEQAVYAGTLEERGMDTASGEYISYGTFTDVTGEGTYYVEADNIGRSCRFRIGEDVYSALFSEIYQNLTESAQTVDTMEQCYLLANLLTAYELYPEVYTYIIVPEVEGDISPVLSFAGTILGEIAKGQQEDGSLSGDADLSAAFSGVSGQFARLCSGYDPALSAQYRWAAEQSFIYALGAGASEDKCYYAAAQLFRLTSDAKYHKIIKDHLGAAQHMSSAGIDLEIYGDVAYLMTERYVDVTLCRELMSERMEEVEQIAEDSHRGLYQTAVKTSPETTGEILDEMVRLAVVDYVITNHEYATVMENYLHFFLGRNPQSVSYLNGLGVYEPEQGEDIMSSPEQSVDLLFMMSAVINHAMDTQHRIGGAE